MADFNLAMFCPPIDEDWSITITTSTGTVTALVVIFSVTSQALGLSGSIGLATGTAYLSTATGTTGEMPVDFLQKKTSYAKGNDLQALFRSQAK